MSANTIRRRTPLAAILMLAAAANASDGLFSTDDGRAENARVIVTGTSHVPLTLISSNQHNAFTSDLTGTLDVSLIHADTQIVSLPLDRSDPIGELPPSTCASATPTPS
ncbi:MAG: hypothetical protein L0271_06380 [Gemmatimonadetes bacterium]|nr:hypothetical protein [Gemmatimonadota bacterium]